MQLSEISKAPQLISISIDDEQTVADFGEAVEFFTYDRQPLESFLKLATAKQDDPAAMIKAIRPLILDKEGKQIITGDKTIPSSLLMKVVAKLVDRLGN